MRGLHFEIWGDCPRVGLPWGSEHTPYYNELDSYFEEVFTLKIPDHVVEDRSKAKILIGGGLTLKYENI